MPLGRLLSNRISTIVEALDEATTQHGNPEIVHSPSRDIAAQYPFRAIDQGSQYKGAVWITTLTNTDIKISIDGRVHNMDNIFVERMWHSLKLEAIFLHKITDGFQAKRIIDNWIGFYNTESPQTALDKRTPHTSYICPVSIKKTA